MTKKTVPLPPEIRLLLEKIFGLELGRVRVCRGFPARLLPQILRARAVTIGNRILLSEREDPESFPAGLLLLVHETVHVLQYREQGFISFLLRYFREFGRGLRQGKGVMGAYRAVGAEVEAFRIESEIGKRLAKSPGMGEIAPRPDLSGKEKIRKLSEKFEREEGFSRIGGIRERSGSRLFS